MNRGIILCGGRSTRMGRPKAWLQFEGELLLPRIVRILHDSGLPVVVVASPGQDLPSLPGDVSIASDAEEGLGPLNGFATGLAAVPESTGAVFLASCDVPFLKPAFVQHVLALLGTHDIAIPRVDGFQHPLAAAYRVNTVLPSVQRLLANGQRRLVDLLEGADVRSIPADELRDADPRLDSLKNVNTPDEYRAATGG